jgi:hypothetical protein
LFFVAKASEIPAEGKETKQSKGGHNVMKVSIGKLPDYAGDKKAFYIVKNVEGNVSRPRSSFCPLTN